MSCGIVAGQGYLLIIEDVSCFKDGISLFALPYPIVAMLPCYQLKFIISLQQLAVIGVNLTFLYDIAAPTYFVLLLCVLLADDGVIMFHAIVKTCAQSFLVFKQFIVFKQTDIVSIRAYRFV